MMRGLIIEDEVLASRHLKRILEEEVGITVIALLESITETIEWFSSNPQPDIVFMDIHLADGSAFEIFRHADITCPIVFTTAYDEYALEAFKVNSIGYLVKPVETDDVRSVLKKLQNFTGTNDLRRSLENLIATYRGTTRYKKHFLVNSKGEKLIPVSADNLACFFIDAGIVRAATFDNSYYTFDLTLEELADSLDPAVFFRANRQYIIAKAAIKDIDLWFNNRLSVNLRVSVPGKIIISKARISGFKNWFGS